MKTICFVVPSFPTVSETFVTNQIIQAKTYGYDVLLLTNKLLPISTSSQQNLLIKHKILDQTYKVDFKIPRRKFVRRTRAFYLIFRHLKYWLRVNSISTRKRFSTLPFQIAFYSQFKKVSVFHVQFAIAGLEIAKMKSIGLLSGNIITTFHGYDAHFENQGKLALLQQRYRLLFKNSRYLTVNTPYIANKVQLLGGDTYKTQIIPMGIDLEFFQSKKEKSLSKDSLVHLISIGRLIELKGFEYAIKSTKIIIDQGYKILYTIVGEGFETDKLLQLISKLKLTESVFLVGAKSQTEIRDLLEENHIFLMSSITDKKNRAEAQGVVTAEAQAMGLPIVGFRCGGVPYTILENKTGILVEEKMIEDYANAITKLLDDPALYRSMSASAKSFAKINFSNEKLCSKFIQLYNEIMCKSI